MPLISIIVPVYNVEKYISDCIESVLNQTYVKWELLLLDDGSIDNSAKICEEYAEKDGRIHLIQNEHSGVSVMRNRGIELSKGKYITFLDSDDQIECDFLEKTSNIFLAKPIDIYMCGMRGIENGHEVAKGIINKSIYKRSELLTEKEKIELIEQNYSASCCAKLIRKEKIGQVRFIENCVFGEDLIFIHELLSKGNTIFADDYIGYNYFKRNGSLIFSVNKKKCEDIIKLYSYLWENIDDASRNGEYALFIKKRCVSDLEYTQKSILDGKYSLLNKYKMLKILLSNKNILFILKTSIGKTKLGKFSFYPSVVLLRYYLKKC